MEYRIRSEQPFGEIEALTVSALEQHGSVVRRTFSLHSVARVASTTGPGYCVFMLYAAGAQQHPVGLITLYQQGGQTVISPVLASLAGQDIDADLVAALVHSGLQFCVATVESEECIATGQIAKDGARLLRDHVCGKWFRPELAEAVVEYGDKRFYLCCSLCREEFERDPARCGRSG